MNDNPSNPKSLHFTLISLNAALGSFCFGEIYTGYTLAELSPLDNNIKDLLDDSENEKVFFYFLYIAFASGGMIGATVGGYVADKHGRRITFYLADFLMMIGSVIVFST